MFPEEGIGPYPYIFEGRFKKLTEDEMEDLKLRYLALPKGPHHIIALPNDYRMEVTPVQVPSIGRIVHYVSYGTPGGEYPSVCRAATITEVGAWVNLDVRDASMTEADLAQYAKEGSVPVAAWGRRCRVVTQYLDPEACALEVSNPTGLFFNQSILHDESKAPGTWHWPERVEAPQPVSAFTEPSRKCKKCNGDLFLNTDPHSYGYEHVLAGKNVDHRPVV